MSETTRLVLANIVVTSAIAVIVITALTWRKGSAASYIVNALLSFLVVLAFLALGADDVEFRLNLLSVSGAMMFAVAGSLNLAAAALEITQKKDKPLP